MSPSVSALSARRVVPLLLLLATVALGLSWYFDRRIPTSAEWLIVALLAAVAVVAAVIAAWIEPADSESTPPWSVHTVWLLPAALVTPPIGFAPLLALSLALGMTRRTHSRGTRLMVASITATTTAEVHWAAQLIDNVAVAGLVGIVALYVTGILYALVASVVFTAPAGTALWLDYRWSFVQMGCALSGLLVAVVALADPYVTLAALAPTLMAQFTLNWPALDRHARIDAKTGLPNARHWEDRSRDLISAAELRGVPVAIAMIDIDHFKNVNDSYGHLVGDEVLQSLAATLRTQVNPGDVIGRFGGEEFVITMFGVDGPAAEAAANRIREAIARDVYSSRARLDTEVDWYDVAERDRPPATFTITATIGVASSNTIGHHVTRLLMACDAALAAGKAAGRNRVEVATPSAAGEGAWRSGSRSSTLQVVTDKRSWLDVARQQQATRRKRRPSR